MLTVDFIKTSEEFDKEYTGNVSAPLFRKVFTIGKKGKAVLSVCGLGYGYFYINGKKVSDDLFTAPASEYDKLCWYSEYDVTDLLKVGKNVIAVICGCGFLNENFSSNWDNNKARWRDNPKFALSLSIDDVTVVKSDDTFLCENNSFVVHNQLRSGETFDARLYDAKWKDLNYDDSKWKKAIIDRDFKPVLRKCDCEPIREKKVYDFISCIKTENGYTLDFGANIAGYIRVNIKGELGQKITFTHAEEIYSNGELKLNGLNVLYPTIPFQSDTYICGEKKITWSPKFTYHGFRYVHVVGLKSKPKKGSIRAVFVCQDVKKNSNFSCSNELLNKIYNAGIISTYSNMHYVFTDCPTREKFGWMNDAQASAEQVCLNFDSERFLSRWIDDIKTSMKKDGQIPAIVPTHGYGFAHGPVADGALFELPYRIYQYKGNEKILIDCIPYMERYLSFFLKDDIVTDNWLGDWDGYHNHMIDKNFLKKFYAVKFCKIISIAKELCGQDNSKYIRIQKQNERNLIEEYIDKNGECIINNQTAVAMMLNITFNKKLLEQLKKLIKENKFHLSCGMLGVQYIYNALSDNGLAEYAYKVVTAKGIPSFDNWFNNGATTLWETWEDSGFTDSRNHHMFSNVLAWFFNYLLGIKVDNTIYDDIRIAPVFIKDLNFCEGGIETKYGLFYVKWKRLKNGKIDLRIKVPKELSVRYNGKELNYGQNKFII